jgi:hypothetical protein
MFQGKGMILEWGMSISHGRMPSIAGLRNQAEVCQLQFPHQPAPDCLPSGIGKLSHARVQRHDEHQQAAASRRPQVDG